MTKQEFISSYILACASRRPVMFHSIFYDAVGFWNLIKKECPLISEETDTDDEDKASDTEDIPTQDGGE